MRIHRIQPGKWLIQNDDFRITGQGLCKLNLLLVSLGQLICKFGLEGAGFFPALFVAFFTRFPFIIIFFATWCKPCNRELNAIHEVYEDWVEETGVKLYAISIDEAQNVQRVKPLVDGYGWEYEVLLDPNSDFRRAMGVPLIPHVFVIDGNGKVALSRSGYTEGGEEHLIEVVRELIDGTKQ